MLGGTGGSAPGEAGRHSRGNFESETGPAQVSQRCQFPALASAYFGKPSLLRLSETWWPRWSSETVLNRFWPAPNRGDSISRAARWLILQSFSRSGLRRRRERPPIACFAGLVSDRLITVVCRRVREVTFRHACPEGPFELSLRRGGDHLAAPPRRARWELAVDHCCQSTKERSLGLVVTRGIDYHRVR